jgi:hypothetical protein
MIAEVSLAAELGELVYMERRIQTLDKESVASLAISYITDDGGITSGIWPISFLRVGIVLVWNR